MAKIQSVDAYLAALPEPARRAVSRVRSVLKKALPRAEETISYDMPTYKQDDRPVLYLAGWKAHFSLYPATPALVRELAAELAPYSVNKGTIRFPLSESVPAQVIQRIAAFRAREAAAAPVLAARDDAGTSDPPPAIIPARRGSARRKAAPSSRKPPAPKQSAKQPVAKQSAKQPVARASAKKAAAKRASSRRG